MAVDYFLKLDGIPGESANVKHKNEIQLTAFSLGGSQISAVGHGTGSGSGKVDLTDFSVMKFIDKATTPFFKSLTLGTHIQTGTLTATKAGANQNPFLTISFKELFVTSYQISASSEIPNESVSFSYNEIKIEYSTQDERGTSTMANSTLYNTQTGSGS